MLELRPIVVDENNIVLGGNMRLKACLEVGLKEVFIVKAEDLTEQQKDEFIVKDNVGFGEWDWDILANEWDTEKLQDWGLDLPLDLSVEELEAEEDNYEIPDEITTDIVLGDLFEIGEHRLLCGDSTDSDSVAKLMNGVKADMVFTDPPYGVAINNANGKILGDEDLQVFDECLPNIELFSKEDSHIYIYFGVQFISECVSKIKEYFKQTNILIQRITHENKPSPKGYYKNNYEVCYFSNKSGKDFNSGILEVSESTKNDSRYNGDGFLDTYLALNEIKSTEHNSKSIHPTQKTIEICSFYQKVSSKINDLVLDLFLGSGSTMVASHQLKRKCYGMELDPKYCQVIIDRMKKLDPSLEIKRNGEIIRNK
jgi:DNA modification methylase